MPLDVVVKWEASGAKTSASSRMTEVLKHALQDQRLAEDLARRWDPVFVSRGNAVHYLEEPKVPELHPVGTNTSPEDVQYGFEKAREAVLLLRETLEAVAAQPKPPIKEWARVQADPPGAWADVDDL